MYAYVFRMHIILGRINDSLPRLRGGAHGNGGGSNGGNGDDCFGPRVLVAFIARPFHAISAPFMLFICLPRESVLWRNYANNISTAEHTSTVHTPCTEYMQMCTPRRCVRFTQHDDAHATTYVPFCLNANARNAHYHHASIHCLSSTYSIPKTQPVPYSRSVPVSQIKLTHIYFRMRRPKAASRGRNTETRSPLSPPLIATSPESSINNRPSRVITYLQIEWRRMMMMMMLMMN